MWWVEIDLNLGCLKTCRAGWVRRAGLGEQLLYDACPGLAGSRVASGSLTTCSNPLLFIGNLFPRDTKVQGHSTTGSVGLGVSDKIRATTDDLTCKHSSWALNHVSGFSGQGMQSDSHTLPCEFNTLHLGESFQNSAQYRR